MRVILAGGGTGGHLFPAIALAQEFRIRDKASSILFIGSKKGLEGKILPGYGFELKTLDVEGIKGKGFLEKAVSIFKTGAAVLKSRGIIKMFKPDFVIGTGGYTSFPVVMAAWVMRIRTAILEQNILPGIANKILGRFVDRIFVAFSEVARFFPEANVIVSGNPVRKEILGARGKAGTHPQGWVGASKKEEFTILIFGGSQGAKAVNSIFLDALEYLLEGSRVKGQGSREIKIIHQTGEDDYERVKEEYDRIKGQGAWVNVDVLKFIDDMAGAYRKADLVICRSGATSIAEIAALGLASILIPFPYASDNHQEMNARHLSQIGAAIMIRQSAASGKKLADEIMRLYENTRELNEMGEKALSLAMPDAGKAIAEEIYKMVA